MRHCPNCGEDAPDESFDPMDSGEMTLGGTPLLYYRWHCDKCRCGTPENFDDRHREKLVREFDFAI